MTSLLAGQTVSKFRKNSATHVSLNVASPLADLNIPLA
jgi:hypothetical protein